MTRPRIPRLPKEGPGAWRRNLPTKRQRDVLNAIITLTNRIGYPPSLREMKAKLGTSPQNIARHLNALREKGAVTWHPYKARTLHALCKIDGRGIFFVPGALQGEPKERTT